MAKGRGSGAVWLRAAVLLHCRNAKPARPFSGMEFLSPSNAPGEMPPGTRAASLGPGTRHSSVSFSLETSLEMPLLLLLPAVLGCGCAPSSGAGHVGVGISPKQPQTAPKLLSLLRTYQSCPQKNGGVLFHASYVLSGTEGGRRVCSECLEKEL